MCCNSRQSRLPDWRVECVCGGMAELIGHDRYDAVYQHEHYTHTVEYYYENYSGTWKRIGMRRFRHAETVSVALGADNKEYLDVPATQRVPALQKV